LTSPVTGATFTAPAVINLAASASDPENRLARVDFYQGTTLLGSAATAPYTLTWSSVAAGSYALSAKAYDQDGGVATSAAVNVTVTALANQPPSVSLTSPANGATMTAPATIKLAASASDPENRMARVDFYKGTTLLGSSTTAPYTFTWSNVPAGSYALSAKAFDQNGGVGTSATVNVTVTAPANQPPSVSLTSPSSGAAFTAPATINLAASASDPENRMARVEFYQGTTLLGSVTTAPYTFTWNGVAVGSYALSAKAFDQDGGVGTSTTVNVTVTSVYSGPKTVIFAASTDNAIVSNYMLDVFANGADPNTATPIASSNLGKPSPDANNVISVDQTAFFMALAPGTYVATVSAIDSGGRGRGAPVTFVR
jgi:predicted phage tail protein